jgi:hypothetical protein
LVALAVGGLAAGCDSDAKIARSAEGESCTKTSDCNDGLSCKSLVCVSSGSDVNNNEGGDGNNSAAGNGPVGPTAPVLGGPGETCGKRTDCQDGLACLSGRCTTEMAGEGGGSSGPSLGGIGETCGLTSDCQDGLQCLPSDGVRIEAIGSNSVGVCTPTKNGLTPTGNLCGAECKTAADCCELPIAVHVPYSAINSPGISGPYGTGAKSCTELAALLDGVNCDTTIVAAEKVQCFAKTAYCECGKTTWTCTEAGRCEYTAACSAAASGSSIPNGCPTYTRLGLPHITTCNKAKKCALEATTGCKADKDCDETVLIAEGTDTCANGKCTCDTDNGLCYRSCTEDLDCPVHYLCDTKASLCRGGHECDMDSFCVTRYDDINKKCVKGFCESSCNNDLDCNSGRLTNYSSTRVCNANHQCEDVGCASDDECLPVGGVRTFCTKAVTGTSGEGVVSAVTD